MKLDKDFWQGRRVLVTGHTGFKGTWLALVLAGLGARVSGIALEPDTDPAMFDMVGLAGDLDRHHIADIRDAAALGALVSDIAPDIVMHLAAQPLVRRAYRAPHETFATNTTGTLNLLEAVRVTASVQTTLIVTTDKVYENAEWVWPYRETDRLGGKEPYGASKAAAEIVTAAYRDSYFAAAGRGLMTLRAGNVVGGGDWSEDRLVPDLMRAFSSGSCPVIRNPAAVRPWQHVLEAVMGYLVAAQHLADDPARYPAGLNFGPDAADFRTVREVADIAATTWGQGAEWKHEPDGSIPEATLLSLDNALARTLLGWRPTWTFDACMRATVQWYADHARGADMRAATERQIAAFLNGEETP